MPRIKDHMENILSVVADMTEIPCELIKSRCSRADVVDARWIAVWLMRRAGIYAMNIADHMRITPRYVQYIMTDFEDRIALSKPMRMNYDAVRKRLGI